jgi:hypothetical protein
VPLSPVYPPIRCEGCGGSAPFDGWYFQRAVKAHVCIVCGMLHLHVMPKGVSKVDVHVETLIQV